MPETIPSGIPGLDEVIGGFPRNGLVVVAGNPGTGKTMLCSKFVYNGIVNHGDFGIYVSFSEGRREFFTNMAELGMDFEKLERDGSFRFLDMLTVSEAGVPEVFNIVLETIDEIAPADARKRLVIDSFTSLAQAMKTPANVRTILHSVVGKITRRINCTTLLVLEIPFGREEIGVSVEEFVADAVLVLKRRVHRDRLLRQIELLKVRGCKVPQPSYLFTLGEGFRLLPTFERKLVEKPKRMKPIPDTERAFSTGCECLDEYIGGYPKGGTILIEVDENVTIPQYHLLLEPTAANFLVSGRGVMLIPARGVDSSYIKQGLSKFGLTDRDFNELMRISEEPAPGVDVSKPYAVVFSERNLSKNIRAWYRIKQELKERTKQPILLVTGIDTIEAFYGQEGVIEYAALMTSRIRRDGDLEIYVSRPGTEEVAKRIAAMADVHVKLENICGSVILYFEKPWTGIYHMEEDVSRGYPLPKLTPIA